MAYWHVERTIAPEDKSDRVGLNFGDWTHGSFEQWFGGAVFVNLFISIFLSVF